MLSIIESFESMNISKKRVRTERYENVQEIDNLFKSIKISNNGDDEEADDDDECGGSDDDSPIPHKEEYQEEEYQELIKYWNIDNTEDIDYPDPEKEVYGYETLHEGFYDSDGKDEFDYWTSDNDFNDND